MKDNFSVQASLYAKYRPRYPKELFNVLLKLVPEYQNALDVGTGNGQVAMELAPHFQKVYALDISEKQLQYAPFISNIEYVISAAEKTDFPSDYFDLITVAQAIHWFNFGQFFSEVKRIAKNGSIIAVWGYGLCHISADIDNMIYDFYKNIVGPYWDPERRFIEEKYISIPFPFQEIILSPFSMIFKWSLSDFEGYLNTWSSVQKFIRQNGNNPVPTFVKKLLPYWKEDEVKEITFPVFIRVGQISK